MLHKNLSETWFTHQENCKLLCSQNTRFEKKHDIWIQISHEKCSNTHENRSNKQEKNDYSEDTKMQKYWKLDDRKSESLWYLQ